jgi:hypothetical protein
MKVLRPPQGQRLLAWLNFLYTLALKENEPVLSDFNGVHILFFRQGEVDRPMIEIRSPFDLPKGGS